MYRPLPEQISIVRDEVLRPEYAGLSAQQGFELFHRPSRIPNPVPAPMISGPLTKAMILATLQTIPADEIRKCAEIDSEWVKLRENVPGGREVLIESIELNKLMGNLSEASYNKFMTLLTAQVPDPTWPLFIDGPSRFRRAFPDVAGWTVADEDGGGEVTGQFPWPDFQRIWTAARG